MSDAPPRILFDTSVLFSKTNLKRITRLVDRDQPAFVPLWSEWVIGELYYGLAWQWAERLVASSEPLSAAHRRKMGVAAKLMLRHMLPLFETVSLSGWSAVDVDGVPDPDDTHLHEAARRGRATMVVVDDGKLHQAAERSSTWGASRLVWSKDFFADQDADDVAVEPLEPDEDQPAPGSEVQR